MPDDTLSQEEGKSRCGALLVPAFVIGWYFLLMAHFLLVAKIANALGDPTQIPEWVASIDRFFVYHLQISISFVFEILWLGLVAASGFIVYQAAFHLVALLGKAMSGDASSRMKRCFNKAAASLFLPIAISMITLAIIPAEAMRKPSTTWLRAGESMQFLDFVDALSKASYFVFMALLLFVVLFGVVGLMIRFLPDSKGFWQLPVAIVISLVVSIGSAIGLVALMEPILSRVSGYSSLLFLFAFYAMISVLVSGIKWFMTTREGRG
jgi:hypothetical protein